MANTKREKLFAEFPPVPTEKWEEVIAVDLKGADYERKLVWRTPEGFNVRPYYRAENLEGLESPRLPEPGEFPYVRGTRCDNVWRVHQSLTVKCPEAANAEALKLLDSGVDSLGFSLTKELSAAEVETLLRDIHLPAVEVVFSGEGVADVVEPVLAKIEKEGWQETASVHFVLDPIINRLSLTGAFCSPGGEKCFEMLAGLVRRTAAMKGVRVVTVSGENFSNAGSTIVEELAFTLSAGHEYLVRLMDEGLTVDERSASSVSRWASPPTTSWRWPSSAPPACCGPTSSKGTTPKRAAPCKLFAHAVTSTWNQTVYDPYINMLRGTTEAMSAAIAGVHSLEVTPFNASFAEPDEFSKRIARNVELLLKHESHFDQVVRSRRRFVLHREPHAVDRQPRRGSSSSNWRRRAATSQRSRAGYVVERVDASAAAKDKSDGATRRDHAAGCQPVSLTSRRWPTRRLPTRVTGTPQA